MHMMMQVLKGGDGPCLPYSVSVMNTCSKMATEASELQLW